MVAEELAAADIPVILNPMINMPMEFSGVNATFSNAARLHAAGVLIAFSNVSNPNPSNPEIIRQAAGLAVAHGLPWEESLKAITINPAIIWELDDQYGSVEPGKDADLVIWDGDPLEVMSYPVTVFIKGEAMPNDSRQIRLRDRYRNLPKAGDIPPAYH
jgi:imidazolonepropionase-like amidohydrolase